MAHYLIADDFGVMATIFFVVCGYCSIMSYYLQSCLNLQKRSKPRKKTQAEKLTGITMVTETRGQDTVNFASPDRENSIELPDLDIGHSQGEAAPDIRVTVSAREVCMSVEEILDSAFEKTVKSLSPSPDVAMEMDCLDTDTSHSETKHSVGSSADLDIDTSVR